MADPDSQKRGGELALQAGGLPARHSITGSVCVCAYASVCGRGDKQRGIRGRKVGWVYGEKETRNERKNKKFVSCPTTVTLKTVHVYKRDLFHHIDNLGSNS